MQKLNCFHMNEKEESSVFQTLTLTDGARKLKNKYKFVRKFSIRPQKKINNPFTNAYSCRTLKFVAL